MNKQLQLGTMVISALAFAACGNNEPANIGDVAALGSSLSDYRGTWDGYVEASAFSDGSDRVRLTLDDNGNGVIEVGDSAPLPPPVADKGYPMQDPNDPSCQGSWPWIASGSLVPGFSYPVTGATVEAKRIRFQTTSNEIYRDWCSLMTPILDEANSTADNPVYACLPALAETRVNEQCILGSEPVDCCLRACVLACKCDENACSVGSDTPDVQFDGALQADGNELEGTMTIDSGLTVRLTRQ